MNWKKLFACGFLALGFVLVSVGPVAFAHSPGEFLEVVVVKPETNVSHDVDLQSTIDPQRSTVQLEGPTHFSRAVGAMGRQPIRLTAFANWYRIAGAKSSDTQKPSDVSSGQRPTNAKNLVVVDLIRGSSNQTLRVGDAEFLISPTQVITSGPPAEIPEGLDLYKAYPVLQPPKVNQPTVIKHSGQKQNRTIGEPKYVCVAAQQWHHDDHIAASHPKACYVVYELDRKPDSNEHNTIDQFGLNSLTTTDSVWLCVRGILKTKPASSPQAD